MKLRRHCPDLVLQVEGDHWSITGLPDELRAGVVGRTKGDVELAFAVIHHVVVHITRPMTMWDGGGKIAASHASNLSLEDIVKLRVLLWLNGLVQKCNILDALGASVVPQVRVVPNLIFFSCVANNIEIHRLGIAQTQVDMPRTVGVPDEVLCVRFVW